MMLWKREAEFDGVNNQVKATSPGGRVSEKLYSPEGKLLKEVIPGAGEIKYIYTDNKLTQKIHYPETAGVQERRDFYFYDTKDRLISSSDAMWQQDSMIYDVNGRLMEYMFKDGRRAKFMYDENGNLTTIIPPGKTAHLFEFDAGDKKTGYKPPEVNNDSLNYIKYFYNEDGNLVKTLYPDSSAIEMLYDDRDCGCSSSGRVRDIVFDRGIISYDYNSTTGQITQVTTSTDDTLSYTYDGSLPKSETWRGSVKGTVSNIYNNDFQLTQQLINGAYGVTYKYDNDGLPTKIGELGLAYNSASGQLVSDTLGNIISNYTYTSFGELRSYTVKADTNEIFKTIYTRDDLGRITRIDETINDSTTVKEYTYDTSGRLTVVKNNNVVTSEYVYDSNGNRLAHIVGADTTNAIYDEQDRLLTYGTEVYLHDKNGYLTTKIAGTDSTKYVYDDFGNLINVLLPNGDSIEYLIDANNRRIGKLLNGSIVSKYVYKDQLNPIAELDSLNNVVSRFIYGAKSNVPEYIVKGDSTYKVVSDHLGSVRLVINTANGEITKQIDYNEFGNVLTNIGNFEQPFGYAGGLNEAETGLIRFGARDYDPVSGRWTSKDPLNFAGGDYNLYGYVLSDPINKYDITGNFYHNIASTCLAFTVTGAAIGVGTQMFSDFLTGSEAKLEKYIGAAVGGAFTGLGMAIGYNPVAVGSFSAFMGEATSQSLGEQGYDYISLFTNTVGGALGGKYLGNNIDYSRIAKSLLTKLDTGVISGISTKTLSKTIGTRVLEYGLLQYSLMYGIINSMISAD